MIVILGIIQIGLFLAAELVEVMIGPSMGAGNRASLIKDADMRAYGPNDSRSRKRRHRLLDHAARVDVLRRALDYPDLPACRAFFGDADVPADDAAEYEDSQGSTGNVTIS